MYSKNYTALALACLITFICGTHAAFASNRNDITLINKLGEPITSVKILYDTPYGEPRLSSSNIILPPEREYRLGIQGVTLPTRIILFLPLASYDFSDLSGLEPNAVMRLEVVYENGVPRLKREDDAEKSIAGAEHKFLSPKNRPYALDRNALFKAKTMKDVQDMIAGAAASMDPPEMNLEGILFMETIDKRTSLYFPILWTPDLAGYASASPVRSAEPDGAIALTINVPLPENDAHEAVNTFFSDLLADGYRPGVLDLRAEDDGDNKEVNFLEDGGDKSDDSAVVLEALTRVLKKETLVKAEMIWVTVDAFDKAKADKQYPKGPGVRVRIANGKFQALFLP